MVVAHLHIGIQGIQGRPLPLHLSHMVVDPAAVKEAVGSLRRARRPEPGAFGAIPVSGKRVAHGR